MHRLAQKIKVSQKEVEIVYIRSPRPTQIVTNFINVFPSRMQKNFLPSRYDCAKNACKMLSLFDYMYQYGEDMMLWVEVTTK